MDSTFQTYGISTCAARMLWLAALGAVAGVSWPHLLAGQDAVPLRISRLRGELAGQFELNPEDLQLNVPPVVTISPGAIVCVSDERGLEVIDRLPNVVVNEQPARDSEVRDEEIRDIAETREDSLLLKQLFGSRVVLPPGIGIQIGVRNIRRRSLDEQDPQRLAALALRSRPAVAAFRAEREPQLVHEVFVGKLQFEVWLGPTEGAELRTVLEGFRLDRGDTGPVTIAADKEVSFAFRASRLTYRIANGVVADVTFEPARATRKSGSAWELAATPPTATAAAPEAPDGHEVTVLYATCRAVGVVPPTIAALMSRFLLTANGLFTAAIIVIILLVGALVFGVRKRLTLLGLAAGLALGLAVFFAIAWVDAKRQRSLAAKVTGVYGNKRGELRYGLSKVSVPKQRQRGEFNTPFAFYVIQLPEDPEKHFVVTELQENREAFFRELKDKVAASSDRNAFVFIHGYNVPFADAVKRTAQLTVDLQFAGAPICYSWPSQGDLTEYVQDSTNAEVAAYKLKQLLQDLNSQSGAKEIHLVAHSMGNDVLTRALKELGKEALGKPDCVFREVLLTAPDIDTELFETEILPAFLSSKQRITLYASSNDKALNASFNLRGSPRAGLAGEYLLVAKGVETIDVSSLDTGFLGHAYYGDHPLVVGDMLSVLCKHQKPGERGLQERAKSGLPYWEFVR